MGKKVLILFTAGLLIVGVVYSRERQTGTISGVVRTPEGDPLPSVIVLLKSPALDLPEIEAVTNASGMYGFPCLPPGTYELTFIFSGLQHVKQSGVVVSPEGSVSMDINLPLRAKDEAVVVEGDIPKKCPLHIAIPEILLRLRFRGLYPIEQKSIIHPPNSLPL